VSLARRLLLETGQSVTRIAADAGFSDASHLVRAFRAAEGVTPQEFRRRSGLPASAATGAR